LPAAEAQALLKTKLLDSANPNSAVGWVLHCQLVPRKAGRRCAVRTGCSRVQGLLAPSAASESRQPAVAEVRAKRPSPPQLEHCLQAPQREAPQEERPPQRAPLLPVQALHEPAH
jgi:hypothetical protein